MGRLFYGERPMKIKMFIQYREYLPDDITSPDHLIKDGTPIDGLEVYEVEAETEAQCLAELFQDLFADGWSAVGTLYVIQK